MVSNAGIALGGPLEHLPIATLRLQLEVNVLGALALVQGALPYLPPERGRVVFVGSIAGRALSDAPQGELAPARISVSLVEPGSVQTPIWRRDART